MPLQIFLENKTSECMVDVAAQFEYTRDDIQYTKDIKPIDGSSLDAGKVCSTVIDNYVEATNGDKLSAHWAVQDENGNSYLRGVTYTYIAETKTWKANPEQNYSSLDYEEINLAENAYAMTLNLK